VDDFVEGAGYSASTDPVRVPDAAGKTRPWTCGQAHKIDAVPLL
jgi:hypothetical protein